jgi:DNA polymerase-3 subunit gamma/tau
LVDVHEIDAASNRRIAEMRDLLDQVAFAPAQGRYKVYILDEAHMLTADSANAFLKTLEEPPPHVLFVLATTEAHKILPTISSRCQVYEFRKIGENACMGLLDKIAREEGVELGEGVARFVAQRSGGAMRDALALLERLISNCGGKVQREDAIEALGLVPEGLLVDLAGSLIGRRPEVVYRVLDEVTSQGRDARRLLVDLVSLLRDVLRFRCGVPDALLGYSSDSQRELERFFREAKEERLLSMLSRLDRGLVEARSALLPDFAVELSLLEALHLDVVYRRNQVESRLAALEEGKGTSPIPAPVPIAVSAFAPRLVAAAPQPPTVSTFTPVSVSASPVAAPSVPLTPIATPEPVPLPGPAPVLKSPPTPAQVSPPETGMDPVSPGPQRTEPAPTAHLPPVLNSLPGEDAAPDLAASPASSPLSARGAGGDLTGAWRRILERARKSHPITAGFLREASLVQGEDGDLRVVLMADFSFHHGKLREPKHHGALSCLLQGEFGDSVAYQLILEGGESRSQGRSSVPRRELRQEGRREVARSFPKPSPLPKENGGGATRSVRSPTGRGRDWYEEKVLQNQVVQDVVETFDGEVLAIE